MIALRRLAAGSATMLAVAGLLTTPVAAAGLPVASPLAAAAYGPHATYDSHAGDAQGWGDRRWRRHSRDHIRTGDAIAGIAILGAVVAIASAASNENRTTSREVYRDNPPRQTWRNSDGRGNDQREPSWGQGSINSAVNLCVNQIERGDDRVGSVDNAARDGSGWRVDGALENGEAFRCRIDNEGRIRSIDLGDGYAAADVPTGDAQWSDDAYLSARVAVRQQSASTAPAGVDADLASQTDGQPQPAYPGGPLPGEDGYEDSLGG
jgi:hypothetical protein